MSAAKKDATPAAGAEIITPTPVEIDAPLAPPGPPAGFAEIENPDLPGVIAVVPEAAVNTHRARGWVPVGELDQTPEDSSGETIPTKES